MPYFYGANSFACTKTVGAVMLYVSVEIRPGVHSLCKSSLVGSCSKITTRIDAGRFVV